ncbi:MAG TPA: glycoside hydrolase family 3 protein [Anaerolineae bacterium]|nr:glycoside hydrolase family 3 protein [Anaerolineae bacterium]
MPGSRSSGSFPRLLLVIGIFAGIAIPLCCVFLWVSIGSWEEFTNIAGEILGMNPPPPSLTRTSTLPPTSSTTPTVTITPTPSQTPTPTPTYTPTPDPRVQTILSQMTLKQMVGQLVMTGVNGQEVSEATCQFIRQLAPGAVVYRTGNVISPEQLRQTSSILQRCAQAGGVPLFISVDHEGQYVTRFQTVVTIYPPAMAQGATLDAEIAYRVAISAASELAFSGVNMVLGPVADVLIEYDNTVISQRSFGGDPELVSDFVAGAVKGYLQAGLIPVLKHFPGHGGVAGDSHYTLPIDDVDCQYLRSIYLPPFQAGFDAGASVVMTSHVAFPCLDETARPATLSEDILRVLRDEMFFQGVILTDSMSMSAITEGGRTIPEASVEAVRAGVDMLLITSPEQALATRNRLEMAVQQGEISMDRIQDAVERILTLKASSDLISFPLSETSAPDWEANRALALGVGHTALALLKDELNLVPIPSELRKILIIGPTDGWGLYPLLTTALHASGFETYVVRYSSPWSGPIPEVGYLESLPKQTAGYDLILMLTWESHLNQFRYDDLWQVNLVEALLLTGKPMIVVALKSPTDILDFPRITTYMSTYGTTSGQLQALADALVGDYTPSAQSPLPGLP